MIILHVVTILLECLVVANFYEEDSPMLGRHAAGLPAKEEQEFEPIISPTKESTVVRNINCDEFTNYAMNCTFEAALMYNTSKKSPPLPAKVSDWCTAIRHLTNCAIDWNSDCKDVTESYFNEESIRGHMHVLNNICDDEWFLSRYDALPDCIGGAGDAWEACYTSFKKFIDAQKNTTHEWTHFDVHFQMCCARALFRRCTLNALFDMPEICGYEQAVTLQKFSVIVSEGDVFQNCDTNMMYNNCPGGDPRPSGKSLAKLMNADSFYTTPLSGAIQNELSVFCTVILVLLCCLVK